MTHFAPKRLRFEKDVIARVHRSLRGKGQLNVEVGQEVAPEDIIGTGLVSGGFRVLNLAQSLSIAPSQVKKYLRREVGQKIYKGELLAQINEGFLRRQKIVTSPSDGILEFINDKTGEIRLTLLPQRQDLPAAVYGVVEKVDKLRSGVVIRTQVSRVYGTFGVGSSRDGTLTFLGKRDELVGALQISSKNSDQSLVGGSLIYKEAIATAISNDVRGIITGGINAKDYRGMAGGRLKFPRKLDNDIGVSILVCEGFGTMPIGEDIYEILLTYNERFVFLEGNHAIMTLPSHESSSMTRVKNTQLPELPPDSALRLDKELEEAEIRIGSSVRIVGSGFGAEQGKVVAADKLETLLPSGILALLLTVETKRRKLRIPVMNVELI